MAFHGINIHFSLILPKIFSLGQGGCAGLSERSAPHGKPVSLLSNVCDSALRPKIKTWFLFESLYLNAEIILTRKTGNLIKEVLEGDFHGSSEIKEGL